MTPEKSESILSSIPFYSDPVDLLVCGSTLPAILLAADGARRGLKVVHAMERTNPYPETIGSLRSWFETSVLDEAGLPEPLQGLLLKNSNWEIVGERLYFNPAMAIDLIESFLAEAGVRFFYNLAPALALGMNGISQGVVFGGKTGLFGIQAKTVVDATLPGTIGRLMGMARGGEAEDLVVHLTVELKDPAPRRESSITLSEFTGSVEIHHRYASFELRDVGKGSSWTRQERIRKATAALLPFSWLEKEICFRFPDVILFEGETSLSPQGDRGTDKGVENFFVLGPLGPKNESSPSYLCGPVKILESGMPRIQTILETATSNARRPLANASCLSALHHHPTFKDPLKKSLSYGFSDPGFRESGAELKAICLSPPAPREHTCVLIAGAGVSGVAAATQIAESGIDAICLDRGLEPGGSQTLGGVTKLWYGTQSTGFEKFYRGIGAVDNGLNARAFRQKMEGGRIQFKPNYAVTGVASSGHEIKFVFAIGDDGLESFELDFVIDATGDGSLAAWAGAPYIFGGGMDETTLWGSFAYFEAGRPEARRPFLSPLDERSPWDTVRFIRAMRRERGVSFDALHSSPPFYVAPRESRHIVGGRHVEYLDVLAGRRFKHGVVRASANLDIKGIATSEAARAGFIPGNWLEEFAVTIPFEACLPPSLANVFVTGKAYDIEHDALAMARMQRDMFALGVVAALATEIAAEKKSCYSDLPVVEVQQKMIALGFLKSEDISDDDFGYGKTPESIASEIEGASNFDAALVPSAQLCSLGKTTALKELEKFSEIDSPQVNRVLCFLGDSRGTARTYREFLNSLGEDEDRLPENLFHTGQETPHIMPDQGYAPRPALLLGCLTAGRAVEHSEALKRLLQKLDPEKLSFNARWGYLFAVANGLTAEPAEWAVNDLMRLLDSQVLIGIPVGRNENCLGSSEPMRERHGYLHLALARALFHCDPIRGEKVLRPFLREWHSAWARCASRLSSRINRSQNDEEEKTTSFRKR